jgi:hypothetical protein
MIPKIDLQALVAKDAGANRDLLAGIQEYGFLIVHNTSLSAARCGGSHRYVSTVFPSAIGRKGACQHGKNGIKSRVGCLGQ